MSAPIKNVQLSFACQEDWEKMTPCALGKFCDSCKKPVYDFTDKSKEDLLKTLSENRGAVCGKFTPSQVTDNKSYFGFMKTALATAALFFGLTLNLKAQEEIGQIKMGEVASPIAYPIYPDGGEEGIRRFVEKNLDLSKNKDKGEVTVSYKVDENGLIVNPRIMVGLNPEVDAEILRLVKQLNFNWEKDIDFPPEDMDKMIKMERRMFFRIKKSEVEVFFAYWH